MVNGLSGLASTSIDTLDFIPDMSIIVLFGQLSSRTVR
jgi:hypothetical protein